MPIALIAATPTAAERSRRASLGISQNTAASRLVRSR